MCLGIFLGTEANWHISNKPSQAPQQSGSRLSMSWEWPPGCFNAQGVLWSFWEAVNNRLKLQQGLYKQSHSTICHISMTKNIPQLYLIYWYNQGAYAACAAKSSPAAQSTLSAPICLCQDMAGNASTKTRAEDVKPGHWTLLDFMLDR